MREKKNNPATLRLETVTTKKHNITDDGEAFNFFKFKVKKKLEENVCYTVQPS